MIEKRSTYTLLGTLSSEITNGESGLQGLVKQGLESLMVSERRLYNSDHPDVSKCLLRVLTNPTIMSF